MVKASSLMLPVGCGVVSCCERALGCLSTCVVGETQSVNDTSQKLVVRRLPSGSGVYSIQRWPDYARSCRSSPSFFCESRQPSFQESHISSSSITSRHSCFRAASCADPSPFSLSWSSSFSRAAVAAVGLGSLRIGRRKGKFAIPGRRSGMASAEKAEVADVVSPVATAQPHLFSYPDGVSNASLSEFAAMDDLLSAVAAYITELSANAIRKRDSFTVVLSGGSLVKALSKLLVQPAVGSIDWSKWHVFWADERHVPLSHPDSNYKLAKDELLCKAAIPETQVYTLNDSLDVEGAAQAYESVLRSLAGGALAARENADGRTYPCFDLILLGMGPDGHIASLFPNHPLLAEKERWVMPIKNSPKPPPERITLTLPVINSAKHIAFVATGGGKAEVLQRVLEVQALPGALPAQMVRSATGEVVWFADKAATSALSVDKWADPKRFPRSDVKAKK